MSEAPAPCFRAERSSCMTKEEISRARVRRHVKQNPDAWKLGYAAGLEGIYAPPPSVDIDALAYWAGVTDGNTKRIENNRQAFLDRAKVRQDAEKKAQAQKNAETGEQ